LICAIANWLLIPEMGMMGAAVAYLLAMFVLNFTYWLYVKMKFNLQPFAKTHFCILIITALSFLTGLYFPGLSNIWFDMVVRSLVTAAVYVSLTYVFRISEDINILIDKIIRR
jgi:O-antigen/teichoic acid export membrane protein